MQEPQLIIDAATQAKIIDTLLDRLRAHYVFPETALVMEQAIRQRQTSGEYDTLNDAATFAETLTAHLREVSKDKHLRVSYSARELPLEDEGAKVDDEAWDREFGPHVNYGFDKVERLPGNIGYLEFRAFFSPKYAAEVGIAAMNFLANAYALIIDLRRNSGGNPEMVALMCSYLFDEKMEHLNSLYWRDGDKTQQFWTLPYVPGKRFGSQKPVYVLTSSETFSGAEEFTYNLKNLKRATIVGETTGGGAHPGDAYRLNTHFESFIPNGRAINPISGTNWEGSGIEPDIAVPRDEAFKVAYTMALKQVRESMGEADSPGQHMLAREIERALAERLPMSS